MVPVALLCIATAVASPLENVPASRVVSQTAASFNSRDIRVILRRSVAFFLAFYFNDLFRFLLLQVLFFVPDVYAVTRSDEAIGLIMPVNQSTNPSMHVVFDVQYSSVRQAVILSVGMEVARSPVYSSSSL